MTGVWVVGVTVLFALGFGLFRRATDGRVASAVPAREGELVPSRLGEGRRIRWYGDRRSRTAFPILAVTAVDRVVQ